MSATRTQLVSNTREMMDAASSTRWTDAFIKTVLGYVFLNEWSGILGANPDFRFNQPSVTTASDGTFALSSLTTGTGDSAKNWYKILALTDGNAVVYQQTDFRSVPLAATTNYADPYRRLWYFAGDNVQVLPVGAGTTLTATVNWVPTRVDSLSSDSVTADFPDGHESILWLCAAAELLNKGGAETEAAQSLLAQAARQRQQMLQDIARRSARPMSLAFPDTAGEWGGWGIA